MPLPLHNCEIKVIDDKCSVPGRQRGFAMPPQLGFGGALATRRMGFGFGVVSGYKFPWRKLDASLSHAM